MTTSKEELDRIRDFCAKIRDIKPGKKFGEETLSPSEAKSSVSGETDKETEKETDKVVIRQDDVDHLTHFVQLWTDVVEHKYVQAAYSQSDYPTLAEFEQANQLYNLGFFYVKVNPKCSPGEMLGLMIKIPFDDLTIPGTNQISYANLVDLFPDKLCFQLMVLGDYFKYWDLINPYSQMVNTDENIRMIMSGLGNFAVAIKEKFISNCYDLVKNLNSSSRESVF